MKHKNLLLFCLVFVLSFFQVASAHIGVSKISFKREDIKFEQKDSFDLVKLPDCHLMNNVGEPALPVMNVFVALPSGVEVLGVEVTSFEIEELSGTFYIHPAQPPVPLSQSLNLPASVSPKDSVYNSIEAYPKNMVEYIRTGSLSGQRIAVLRVYPLQYIPSQRKLKLFKDIQFKLNYTTQAMPKVLPKRTEKANKIYQEMIQELVINPEEITSSNYTYKTFSQTTSQNDILEYLIITNESLKSTFQPLADWKTKKGIPAAIRTTEWISSNYSGVDLAEKIREYLKVAHQDSGAVWVLLGGDTQVIPCRYAHVVFPSEIGDIPSDLYFSDLDGNWDYNGNHIYGQPQDSIDMFPDVFVGRAPVVNTSEVQVFVNKAINYEKTSVTDYQNKMLFLAQLLDEITDAGIGKDMIDSIYVPSQFGPVAKLYERNDNTSPAIVVDSMNQSFNIINHNGHANYNIMCTGPGSQGLGISDMYNLINAPRYTGVLYSEGCWPAAIDYNCIAENFCKSPNGGGFFVGNTRYGWYIPSFPCYGAGDLFDQQFFKSLFDRNLYRLGQTLASSKIPYVADADESENDYRWTEFELLLLGDPELPLYTDIPGVLTVEYPETISVNEEQFIVTVTHNSLPVENALVCIMQGDNLYLTAFTGPSGQAIFSFNSELQAGTSNITITAKNFLPWEGQTVIAGETCLSYRGHTIKDSLGNNDGIVNPGENINLSILLKNCGVEDVHNVTGTLKTTDSSASMDDSSADYGDISAGDSTWGTYSFTVSSECPNEHVIYFDLSLSETGGKTWNLKIPITVGSSILSYVKNQIDDGPGGDSLPDPGETINMDIWLRNSGLGNSTGVTATISTSDPYVNILSPQLDFPNIPPGDSAKSNTPSQIQISQDCPVFHYVELYLWANADNYSLVDTFFILVSPLGYFDNMENGDGSWGYYYDEFYGGWHQTTHRFHSANKSWYPGEEGIWKYHEGFSCSLVSPPILLGPNSVLSFWTWYQLESGMDFGLCEINDGNGWQLLEMMTGSSNDWEKKSYDLPQFSGKTIWIRFTLYSEYDDIQLEGWYIDDVLVSPGHIVGIFGKVTDSYTHQSLDSAVVEAMQKSQVVWADTTDTTGNYSLIVSTGEYDIRASRNGYLSSQQNGVQFTQGEYKTIDFGLDTLPLHDLALSVFPPGLAIFPNFAFEPRVLVQNCGTFTDTFNLFFQIDSSRGTVYADTIAGQLARGDSTTFSLPIWTPGDTGTQYTVLAYIHSENDERPGNDTVSFITRPSYEFYWDDGTVEGFYSSPDLRYTYALQDFYICQDCSVYAVKWLATSSDDITFLNVSGWDSVSGTWTQINSIFVSCDSIPPAWNYYRFDPPIVWEPQWGNKVGFSVAVGFDDSMWVDTTHLWPHSWVGSSPSGPWEVYDQGNFMIRIMVQGKYTAVPWETDEKIPRIFSLSNNYPNPFNLETTIEYALPRDCNVTVNIYNIRGQRVKTLVDNQRQTAGYRRIIWGGRNQRGEIVSSGMYFYKIMAGDFVETKKMMLLK